MTGRRTRSVKAWLKRIIAGPARRRGGFERRVIHARARGASDRLDPIATIDRLGIEATGRWTAPLREVGVRPFPFPFCAAFALANENTYADAQLFEDVHGFVSGRGPTPFGEGLGLEVGDSFAVDRAGAPGLALGQAGRDHEARRARLARDGWLDSLYCPDQAARAALAEVVARWPEGERPAVFLGSTGRPEREALRKAGVRFFGDDGLIEIDKFGDHHDYKLMERFRLAAAEYDWSRWMDRAAGDEPPADARRLARLMNETLQPEHAQGDAHLGFKRYCGPWLASMPTFSAQVTSVLLDGLINQGAAVVVQQQLGRWSLIGAAAHRCQARANVAPVLDRHAIATWREIAERQRAGKLWVVTTARLLEHLWRRGALRFSVEKTAARWTICLDCLHCRVLGDRPLEQRDLNGLSFTVPESAPEVSVVVGGARVPLDMTRDVDPVHRLRHAVHRAWRYLEWPELHADIAP